MTARLRTSKRCSASTLPRLALANFCSKSSWSASAALFASSRSASFFFNAALVFYPRGVADEFNVPNPFN